MVFIWNGNLTIVGHKLGRESYSSLDFHWWPLVIFMVFFLKDSIILIYFIKISSFNNYKKKLLLVNHTWVCWPVCGEVSLLMLSCGEGNAGFIAGQQTKSPGQLVLQIPELPGWVSWKRFSGSSWGCSGHTGYVINSCTVLWLVEGEVTGKCHRG